MSRNRPSPEAAHDPKAVRKRSLLSERIDRFWNASSVIALTSRIGNPETRRTDLTIAALGVTLAIICAIFPWYIFMNQQKFGIRAMQFSGQHSNEPYMGDLRAAILAMGDPSDDENLAQMKLDTFTTGSIRPPQENESTGKGPRRQRYKETLFPYRMVHASLGRAMIVDKESLFVVQPGSILPDATYVQAIEIRDGKWVLVTSAREVLHLKP